MFFFTKKDVYKWLA